MGIYLKQLLSGRDFARSNSFAANMANFVYLIGDDEKRECVVVDPAWDTQGILDYIDKDGMKLVGALVTHYHPDHIGGEIWGHNIEGIAELMKLRPVPIHVNVHESQGVKAMTGVSDSDLQKHEGGDEIQVGNVAFKLLHTPGHTPGSQCFLVADRVVSGDTLFIGGCGRVDLPGGNAEQLYNSLTQVLGKLPDETVLLPGHNYAAQRESTIGDEKRTNYYMKMKSLNDWLGLMGR